MKLTGRALCAAVLLSIAATLVQASARTGSYHAATPFIEDRGGRVVVLHGFNMVWKTPPYYPPSSIYPAPYGVTQDASYFDTRDAQLLADHGFNVVRLGLIWKGVEPARGVYDENYLNRMSNLIDLLHRYGIAVLLDFHQDIANE